MPFFKTVRLLYCLQQKPFWADIVASFNMLDPDDVQRLVPTARSGFMFTTLFAEGEKIIQYFYKR